MEGYYCQNKVKELTVRNSTLEDQINKGANGLPDPRAFQMLQDRHKSDQKSLLGLKDLLAKKDTRIQDLECRASESEQSSCLSMETMRKDMDNLKSLIQTLQAEDLSNKRNEAAYRLLIERQEHALQTCQARSDELQNKLDASEKEAKDRMTLLRNEASDSGESAKDFERRAKEAEEALEKNDIQFNTAIQDLQNKLTDSLLHRETLAEQVKKLQEEMNKLNISYKLTIKQNVEHVSGISLRLEEARNQVKRAEKALASLQIEFDSANITISGLTTDRDRRQKDAEKLEEENKVLKRQIEELMAQMKEMKATVKSMLRNNKH